jgi:hypothetical protein
MKLSGNEILFSDRKHMATAKGEVITPQGRTCVRPAVQDALIMIEKFKANPRLTQTNPSPCYPTRVFMRQSTALFCSQACVCFASPSPARKTWMQVLRGRGCMIWKATPLPAILASGAYSSSTYRHWTESTAGVPFRACGDGAKRRLLVMKTSGKAFFHWESAKAQ